MEPIRVAQVMGKMLFGGVESVVMNYYRNIDREKMQFDFIVDHDSIYVPREEIERLGGKIIEVPPYQNIFKYMKSLTKLLKQNNYKIVHSHLNALNTFSMFCAKKTKVPIRIAHVHSTANRKELKKTLIKNILKPFSRLFSTHYFCCSESTGKWLFGNKLYNSGKVTVLNNAIDVEKFKYNEDIRNNVRKELGIEDKLVIGHVGRFVTQKNHKFLIDIFSEAYNRNKNIILILIGEGPLEDKIKLKVKRMGLEKSIIFLGIRDDVNKLMQAMDMFILTSLYEGLPVVGVEAQAAGLLCIFSDNITKELKILETAKFISLTKKSSEWADIILKHSNYYKRKDYSSEIRKAEFDVKIESKKLEKEYIRLIENMK